ncbi:alpha/beta hydrolase [Natronospirillum operosum]|uniref:Alpha/beta hydrolase n=1 Tax=Natronospirillum operosum TaxID=2759953 RepID=A0A4Z0W9X2_9GAMM|nr:alpha/beta hydrolase [Natronospirillum operosum]TGG94942.1 alpha/beta hydrolase [Natronospirillum operosum]
MKQGTIIICKARLLALIATGCLLALLSAYSQAHTDSGHIDVNGLSYYYEIHGEGEPLLLVHGGLGSLDMFEPILPILTASRQVIGVDLQGHGRTALGERPIIYEDMGNDMAALLTELGYDQVDVMGYSMGGAVALRLAIQHPGLVRRLVSVSAGFAHPDGTYPEIIAQQEMIGAEMAEAMQGTPMYESYMELAPNPEDFPRLLDRMGELMDRPFDWSEDIRRLGMPVMLIYGDSDMQRPEHIVEFYQLLGGGLQDAGWQRENMSQNRLAILPNFTHYDIFLAPELARTALPFLNGEYEFRNWGEQEREAGN